MDKNTAYGLILMALVFFGFMYFTTPDKSIAEEQAQTEKSVSDNQTTASTVFTDTEREWLAKNILSNGTPSPLPTANQPWKSTATASASPSPAIPSTAPSM